MMRRRYKSNRGIAAMLVVGIFAAVAIALAMGGMLVAGGFGLAAANNQPAAAPSSGPRIHIRYHYDDGTVSEGPLAPTTSTVASAPAAPETTSTTGALNPFDSATGQPQTQKTDLAQATVSGADGSERPVQVYESVFDPSHPASKTEYPADASKLPDYRY